MAGALVLRDMGGSWLECQDSQGIFYHNQVTEQFSDTAPEQLAAPSEGPAYDGQAEVVVLRELAGSWLECQDAHGVFYLDQVTQQAFDKPPSELMAADPGVGAAAAPAVATGETAVLREMVKGWLECMDEKGVFYFNQVTQQSSDTFPIELQVAPTTPTMWPTIGQPKKATVLSGGIAALSEHVQVAAVQPRYANIAAAPQSYAQVKPAVPSNSPATFPQQTCTPAQKHSQPTVVYQQSEPFTSANATTSYQPQSQFQKHVKLKPRLPFGDRALLEDQAGFGAVHAQLSTGRKFATQPPELIQPYQTHKAAGLIASA